MVPGLQYGPRLTVQSEFHSMVPGSQQIKVSEILR